MKFQDRLKALGRPRAHGKGLKVKAGADRTEILIYDVIGWPWIEALDVVKVLQGITADEILVRINSPGGDVFDGLAIANALQAHPARVITRTEGIAASIASVVALAGDSVEAAESAFIMIHNPWTCMCGDAEELRHTAGTLDKIGGQLAGIYARKSGQSTEDMQAAMDGETWYTAAEAREAGLVDEVLGEANTEAQAAMAGFDLSIFENTPMKIAALAGQTGSRRPPTERELERCLREAGFSRSQAAGIVAKGYSALRGDPAGELLSRLDALTDNLRNLTR